MIYYEIFREVIRDPPPQKKKLKNVNIDPETNKK